MTFNVAAFYRFTALPDFPALQAPLLAALKKLNAKGTVLLAVEGINGTIAVHGDAIGTALDSVCAITGIKDMDVKFSTSAAMPFKRMKVRLKREIVTLGCADADPTRKVGTYVEPEDWNNLISDPDVIVIDTRNDYEVRVGSFARSIDPYTEQFSDFPAFVRERLDANRSTKIAMFCTGGIRCEKASSFMMHEGFENVFHLKGGILKYLERVPAEKSLWQGECFVFDERVAVGHGLAQGTHAMCHGCLMPVSQEDRRSSLYEEGVSCPACHDRLTPEQIASNRERQKQFVLGLKRGKSHLGPQT
jgi:UPF0176 protein